MQRTAAGSRPAYTDPGLPVPAELIERFTAAADSAPQPPGGGLSVRTAAAGYWERRGLWTVPDRVLMAPGPVVLLLASLAATGGDLVLARPAAAWYAPQAELLGRTVHYVPTPAECGGVPDPVALLETVRRARAEGSDPRLLVVAVADDPTGTIAPPELVHEVCEVAAGEGLLTLSDETYLDVLHDPLTVLLGPAGMLPGHTVVLADLAAGPMPPGWPAAVLRFPTEGPAARLHEPVRECLTRLRAEPAAPVAKAAAVALAEPAALRERTVAANRLHATVAAAAHRTLIGLGALCRPPRAGFHLYPDFDPLHETLAARGITDAATLESHLPAALGAHRFGDDPSALRARITTSALYGTSDDQRSATLQAADPLQLPHVAEALTALREVFADRPGGVSTT